MLGLEAATGTVPLPLWAAGALLVLLVAAGAAAFRRSGTGGSLGTLVGITALLMVAWSAWTFVDNAGEYQRAAERRALDARAMELTARAIMPGSALACLDANAGETVQSACERAVFASPEAVAAAVSYVGARLSLLADGIAYVRRADHSYDGALAGLRRAIEADRFGLVAHVLAVRDGCTVERCDAFALLRDAELVKSNLKARTYENNVARYAASWTEQKDAPVAATSPPPAPALPALVATPSLIEFPTAASIPPVSIMNSEPTTGTAAEANAPARRSPASPPARRAAGNETAASPAPAAPLPSPAGSANAAPRSP